MPGAILKYRKKLIHLLPSAGAPLTMSSSNTAAPLAHAAMLPDAESNRARRAYSIALRPAHFPHITSPFQVRWNDQDAYSHANNTAYVEWCDHAINAYLNSSTGFAPPDGVDGQVGLAVEVRTIFLGQVSFPEEVQVGVGVAKLGRSAVTYRCGVFAASDVRSPDGGVTAVPKAVVDFTHAFVSSSDRVTVTPIGDRLRRAFMGIQLRGESSLSRY